MPVPIGTPGYRTVLARATGSGELISVPADDHNLERLDSVELSIPLYRLRDTAGLAPARLGRSPSPEAMDRWLALGLSALAAEMTGAAESGLRGVVEYSKTREAFGVPIGTFQGLQHMAADAYVACEGLRSTNNHASWAVDEEDLQDALLAARVVKAYASRQLLGVAETVMQMYGGIGQTWEHTAHFYARRILLDRYLLGDAGLQLAAIADRRLERLSGASSPADAPATQEPPPRNPRRPRNQGGTMDFRDTPEQADYRAKTRAWLQEHCPVPFPRTGLLTDAPG